MKALVVYFSRSGHTQQLAQEIASRCRADLEEIHELNGRRGGLGYWRAGWQVLTRAQPTIEPSLRDPAAYDVVIIGTPVWIGHAAPAVCSYVRRQAGKFKQVAFFCTEGGSGDTKAFEELGRLCGKVPMATLTVKEKQLPPQLHVHEVSRFATQLAT